jgi:hypothetical protein
VVLAVAAVVCALSAQVLTITRGLNTNNLRAVEEWYRTRFDRRAPLTRAASVLLVLAATSAGVAGIAAVLAGPADTPVLTVSRTAETVVVRARFAGLEPGTVATLSVTAGPDELAQAAVVAGDDGAAEREVTVAKVPSSAPVAVEAEAGVESCTARSAPGEPWEVDC